MSNNLTKFFNPNDFFEPSEPLVVAVSGGVDSMVLLDLLKTLENPIIIAHINHKKRIESDLEYNAIHQYANKINVTFEGFTIFNKNTKNFQSFARQERLNFYCSIAKKYNTNKVLLAHHQDDQVETICMHYTHSKHILDLKGMKKVQKYNDIKLVRPLLETPKSALIDYSKEHQITYFEDDSNKDLRYTRNRFRHKIIPELRRQNLLFDKQILDLGHSVQTLISLIDNHAKYYLSKHNKQMPVKVFMSLHPFLQEAIIKALLSPYTERSFTRKHINDIIQQFNTSKNIIIPITSTLNLHKEYDQFFVKPKSDESSLNIIIPGPGTYPIDSNVSYVVTHDKNTHISSNYCVLWYNEIVFPLYIRTRTSGDTIQLPFGHKKIKDILINKKVPPTKRDTLLLLTNQKEVLWIPFLKLYKHQTVKKHKIYIYEVQNVRERY